MFKPLRYSTGTQFLQDITLGSLCIPTGSAQLDFLLDGGIQTGQVTEICGSNDSRKSALCHNILSSFLLNSRHEKAIFISTTSQPVAAKQLLNLEIELCARLEDYGIRITRHPRTSQFRIRDSPKERPSIMEQAAMLHDVFPDLLEREIKAMEESMNGPIVRDESDESYNRVIYSTYSLILSDIDDYIKAQCRAHLNRLHVLTVLSASELQNVLSELLRFMGMDLKAAHDKDSEECGTVGSNTSTPELALSVFSSLTHETCSPRYIREKVKELTEPSLLDKAQSQYSTKLIIVDSFYSLVAPMLGGGRNPVSSGNRRDSGYRDARSKRRFAGQEAITKIGNMFQALAKQHQVAVIATNSVVACDLIPSSDKAEPTPSESTDSSVDQGTPSPQQRQMASRSQFTPMPLVRPALGNTWVQIPDVTVLCQRTTDANHRKFQNSDHCRAMEKELPPDGFTLAMYKHSFDLQSRIKTVETDLFLRDCTLVTLLNHPTSPHVYNVRPAGIVPTLGPVAPSVDAGRVAHMTQDAVGQIVLSL